MSEVRSVRDTTFEFLRTQGMTTIFGNPGSTELPFLNQFPADFRYVLGLQEAAVVGMADGYAQATGQATVVNLHTAPGLGNAMGAICNAFANRSPLVITAGQQVRAMMRIEALLTNRDATILPRPLVKWAYEPPRPQDVPAALAQATHIARQPPTGPVFVSLPMDDWDQPADDPATALTLSRRIVGRRAAPDPAAVRELADRLVAARNPALVVGGDVDRSGAFFATVQLANLLDLPVWWAPVEGRLGFPQNHPNYRGELSISIKGISDQLAGYDLVLVVGAPVFRYYPYVPGDYLPPGTELAMITNDIAEAARAPMGDAIIADVALTVTELLDLLPDEPVGTRNAVGRTAAPPLPTDEIFTTLARTMPVGGIVVWESASTQNSLNTLLPLSLPGSWYTASAGGLGFGLPAAIGVRLGQPDRPVVAVLGDGAAQYGIAALWTAAHYQVPVTFLVLRNNEYAILKWFAQLEGVSGVPGLDIAGLDYVRIAQGYGITALHADGAADLEAGLRNAFSTPGPTLIEVDIPG